MRQPLSEIKIDLEGLKIEKDLLLEFEKIISDELNIKKVSFEEDVEKLKEQGWLTRQSAKVEIAVNPEISEELKLEGILRELTRNINSIRKNLGLTINDRVNVFYSTDSPDIKNAIEKFKTALTKSVLANEIVEEENNGEDVNVNESVVKIFIEKI